MHDRNPLKRWRVLTWDWLVASDPGLNRLRTALSGAMGVGSAIGVEYGFAIMTHAGAEGTIIAMLLGALVAMMGMMALMGASVRQKVRIAAFFPVALGLGMLSGVAVASNTDAMLAVFVVVMFLAVAIRRFGTAFFFYGFMGWMGYFFASFLGATMAMLPGLVTAIVLATVWVLLLSITVLRTNPERSLQRTRDAFAIRARTLLRSSADMLKAKDPLQKLRLSYQLHIRQAQLDEAALMVEGWSAEPGALPRSRSAPALRRRLIDVQHVLDSLAAAAAAISVDERMYAPKAAQIAEHLARNEDDAAREEALALQNLLEQRLAAADSGESKALPMTQLFVQAALEFLAFVHDQAPKTLEQATSSTWTDAFDPVVDLVMGNLSGSPAVAYNVPARGWRWNPLARLDLPTRQAIQVAIAGGLAILFGRELSPVRYYWAVIAAFVMFAGTATRTETWLKGMNRVLGTILGLVAAVWLAELTAGDSAGVLSVIVVSVFFAFYLMRVSYAYMIFFITIMLGQLYSVLHEFSSGLLLLRLEETIIGAAIGFGVALTVIPLSTRDTVRASRDNLLLALAALLEAVADRLAGRSPGPDLDGLTRMLDDRLRQLALVARPLVHWSQRSSARHRLVLYGAMTTSARALAVAVRRSSPKVQEDLAAFCQDLASEVAKLVQQQPQEAPLDEACAAHVFGARYSDVRSCAGDPIARALLYLRCHVRDLATREGPL